MSAPQRLQRRRTPGWRTPLDANGQGARYVGRGSHYGNPYRVVREFGWHVTGPDHYHRETATREEAQRIAVEQYSKWLPFQHDLITQARRELTGRDLLCWCAPDMPCHADVLLAISNPTGEPR